MMKLYYFPQLCSLATHITLEETGAPYECEMVNVLQQENRKPEYLAKNSKGQVPTLQIDDTTFLSENVAILDYLATTHPDARLAPTGVVPRAQWISLMARMASGLHPTFTRTVRPDMVVEDKAAAEAVSASARKRYTENLTELDTIVGTSEWFLGDQFTTADAYAMVFYNWGVRAKFPMQEFQNFTRWKDRMLERPAVRAVLTQENCPVLEAA